MVPSYRIGRPAVVAVALLLVSAGCTEGPGVSVVTTRQRPATVTAAPDVTIGDAPTATTVADAPTAAPTTAPTTLPDDVPVPFTDAEAADMLTTFSTTDLFAFSILSTHRSDPTVVAAARQQLDAGATGATAWAAAYVWVNEGDDPAPLLTLLSDVDPGIRVMAATGLLGRGRIEGFAPLIALLLDDTTTTGFPPSTMWQDATVSLVRFTGISDNGPPFDATPAQRQAANALWQAWFDAHHDGLSFDPEVALWIVS